MRNRELDDQTDASFGDFERVLKRAALPIAAPDRDRLMYLCGQAASSSPSAFGASGRFWLTASRALVAASVLLALSVGWAIGRWSAAPPTTLQHQVATEFHSSPQDQLDTQQQPSSAEQRQIVEQPTRSSRSSRNQQRLATLRSGRVLFAAMDVQHLRSHLFEADSAPASPPRPFAEREPLTASTPWLGSR